MPIPVEADRREANCDMLARGILGQLRTLRFAGAKDKPRLKMALKQSLDNFAEVTMQAADAVD
jgi:hypothetical protein